MTQERAHRVSRYHYQVYGLTVESALELPELPSIDPRKCNVSIRFGIVPDCLDEPISDFDWISYSANQCLLRIKDIGNFLIENGTTITIDRRLDRSLERDCRVPAADVRALLLGSAFGALLHLRAWLPLHVSAIDSAGGVWAFTGDSGAGKSTIAGWLHRKFNWPMLSDDVSVIRPESQEPILYPGPRKLKLWQDTVEYLGCKDEKLVQDLSNTPKFQLYLSDTYQYKPKPMRCLVVLDRCNPGESPSLEKLKGTQRFDAIMGAVYRPFMAEWFREPKGLMRDLVKLSNQIDIYRFRRQWSLQQMERQLDPLLEEIGNANCLGEQ